MSSGIVSVRFAQPDDWSAVAGSLVELGRGVASGTAEDPTHQQAFGGPLPQARINDLVVTNVARGHGVGTALLTRAEELARKRGCFRLALLTASWRDATIAFYTREGWGDYGRWFVKPLTDGVAPSGQSLDDN